MNPNDPVDEDVPFVPDIPDDMAATTTGDEDVGGPGGAVAEAEPTFPSLDIILCPGVVDEDELFHPLETHTAKWQALENLLNENSGLVDAAIIDAAAAPNAGRGAQKIGPIDQAGMASIAVGDDLVIGIGNVDREIVFDVVPSSLSALAD